MQMCERFRRFDRVGKRELFCNVITSYIKSLIWDRATAAWCNILNIKCTDWPKATKNKRKMNEERWHVTPYDGGGGVDSVDGFVGLVDTGIDWCYD